MGIIVWHLVFTAGYRKLPQVTAGYRRLPQVTGIKEKDHAQNWSLTCGKDQASNCYSIINSLDNKGSCWILQDFYCSVTMLRVLGLKQPEKIHILCES